MLRGSSELTSALLAAKASLTKLATLSKMSAFHQANLSLKHHVPCASTRHRHLLSMMNSMFRPASLRSVCSPNLRYPIATPQYQLSVVALSKQENLLNLPRVLHRLLFSSFYHPHSFHLLEIFRSSALMAFCFIHHCMPIFQRTSCSTPTRIFACKATPVLIPILQGSLDSAATSPAPLLVGL